MNGVNYDETVSYERERGVGGGWTEIEQDQERDGGMRRRA